MKQSDNADGMVQALMDMALFCDRALRECDDGSGSPLDIEVSHCMSNFFETSVIQTVSRRFLCQYMPQLQAVEKTKYWGMCILLQQFPSVVVMYSLKAMRHGCQSAVQRFPRLLQLLDQCPATIEDFKKKVCVLCMLT